MDHYDDNLRHMAEPATPHERERAVSTAIPDYEALYITDALYEWAGYMAPDDEAASIALGYAQYINHRVRKQGNETVTLYAHTERAAEVLTSALEEWAYECADQDNHPTITTNVLDALVGDLWAHHNAEEVNADAGEEVMESAPDDIMLDSPAEENDTTGAAA